MDIPEIDKQVTREVLAELAGQTISHVCEDCHGEGHFMDGEIKIPCQNCNAVERYYPPVDGVLDAEFNDEPMTEEEMEADLEARNNVDLPHVDR